MGNYTLLQSLRENKNWTQDYVAQELDITQSAYAKLEAGHTKLTIDRAKELANLYGIDPETFLGNTPPVVNYNSGSGSFGGPKFFLMQGVQAVNYNSGPNSHGGPFFGYNNYSVWGASGEQLDKAFSQRKDKDK